MFAALGDSTRLRLVSKLCAGGPLSITALADGVDVTRQAVTKHLNTLAAAGLARAAPARARAHLGARAPPAGAGAAPAAERFPISGPPHLDD